MYGEVITEAAVEDTVGTGLVAASAAPHNKDAGDSGRWNVSQANNVSEIGELYAHLTRHKGKKSNPWAKGLLEKRNNNLGSST